MKMKQIKVAEATGPALDWLVANCERLLDRWGVCAPVGFRPSTDWAQGGPIIEREGVNTYQMHDGTWQANLDYGMVDEAINNGPTPLIAAMRCYVASKLGDSVEVPEELL